MKIAIIGSRKFSNLELVRNFVNQLPHATTVISGGAPGPDTVAVETARARGLQTEVILPLWYPAPGLYNRRAALDRNFLIISTAEKVIAFHDGHSTGTAHAISLARQWSKPLQITTDQPSLFPDF